MNQRVADQYELLSRLGSGAMGEVWRGQDVRLDRAVAVKALKAELSSDQVAFERFRTEAIALAKLQHPNIAGIYNFVSDAGQWYLVMELVEGIGLDEWLKAHGKMGWQQSVDVVLQVLSALEQVHRLGLVHRDIKSSNLKLTAEGQVKLLDFGITRSRGQERLTRQGLWIGTLEYASPEQLKGAEADARADLYALGCVLFELLSGHVPFQAATDYELIKAHIERVPPDIAALDPNVPKFLSSIILKSMEKDPPHRFQSAEAFSKALTEATLSTRLTRGLEEASLRTKVAVSKLSLPAPNELPNGLTRFFNWKSPLWLSVALIGVGASLWLAAHRATGSTQASAQPAAAATAARPTASNAIASGNGDAGRAEPAAPASQRTGGDTLPPLVSLPGANPANAPGATPADDDIEVVEVAPKSKPRAQSRQSQRPAVPSSGWGVR